MFINLYILKLLKLFLNHFSFVYGLVVGSGIVFFSNDCNLQKKKKTISGLVRNHICFKLFLEWTHYPPIFKLGIWFKNNRTYFLHCMNIFEVFQVFNFNFEIRKNNFFSQSIVLLVIKKGTGNAIKWTLLC